MTARPASALRAATATSWVALHGRTGRAVGAVVLAVTGLALVAGCAAGVNPLAGSGPHTAGFWLGLWHGLIAPVTFVLSLFTDRVNVYEVRNSGNWYDAGFVLGISLALSGAGGSAAAGRGRPRGS